MRSELIKARRLVVKVGSSLVTNNGLGLDRTAIERWAEQLVTLQRDGKHPVLVSSGAVAEGVARLELKSRPRAIHMQQAAAAVGQMGLIQAYESCFSKYAVHAAQILLSHEDLSNRKRYLNARSTLITLMDMAVIPVVNENDTVATAELCFGDNDTLAALVANLIGADAMILLTDQTGLYDSDPRLDRHANLIGRAQAGDARLLEMAGTGTSLGKGGMRTKLSAAKLAARSGACTVIADGREPDVLLRLLKGEELGTLLTPESGAVAARKQWLAGRLKLSGKLELDAGAVDVLKNSGRSLLAVGITATAGKFERGDVVACLDAAGIEIARGLVNYNCDEIQKIKGLPSSQIEKLLGYSGEAAIIHRDNMVLTG